RHHGADGRAERAARAAHGRPRLRDGERAHRAVGRRAQSARRRPRACGVPGRLSRERAEPCMDPFRRRSVYKEARVSAPPHSSKSEDAAETIKSFSMAASPSSTIDYDLGRASLSRSTSDARHPGVVVQCPNVRAAAFPSVIFLSSSGTCYAKYFPLRRPFPKRHTRREAGTQSHGSGEDLTAGLPKEGDAVSPGDRGLQHKGRFLCPGEGGRLTA